MALRRLASVAFALVVLSGPALADVTLAPLGSVPRGGNAVVSATVGVDQAGTPRVYFRRKGFGDFYYVPMQPAGDGSFWGVLPKPGPSTERLEIFVSLRDGFGTETERTSVVDVPVSGGGASLTGEQAAAASNLTVGDSAPSQSGHSIAWFSDEGVAARVGIDGDADANGDASTDNLGNVIVIGHPGPVPAPKEVTLPRP